jgi:imidazolonepropionase-like amidohydrolase
LELKKINAATADAAEALGQLHRKVKRNEKGRIQIDTLTDII